MISDIKTVLDIILAMRSNSAQNRKSYFENYVDPIWVLFEKIHGDYKVSFQEYLVLLEDKAAISVIRERVAQDVIFSADLRTSLRNLLGELRTSGGARLSASDGDAFLDAISSYFFNTLLEADPTSGTTNAIRTALIVEMYHSDDHEYLKRCVTDSLSVIQRAYGKCHAAYLTLKNQHGK